MEDLSNRSLEELEARVAEIKQIAEKPEERSTEELNNLLEEKRAILAELENRKATAQAEERACDEVAKDGEIKPMNEFESEERKMSYSVESPEYRSGLLKDMLGQELTAEERDAVSFVATTTDATYGSGNVLPKKMVDEIWDLIDETHAILGDITLYRTGTILELAYRSAINQGDAKSVNENAANDDEINTFAKVTLNGKDFSKHVDISYAMAKMSVDAFESFLVREIADRIGAALAKDVIAQILTDYDDTNNAITTAAEGKMSFADIASTFATLKNAKGNVVVYGSHATIYKYLVSMADTTGRPMYQMNMQDGAEGQLIGADVKVEDGISGDVLLIGYPKQVVGNMVQDIMVETDRDIKKHVITYAGYARFESKLVAPKAFATLTVDSGE